MRIRRGPRLLSRLPIALLVFGILGPAIGLQPVPASALTSACPVNNSFGDLCLVSTSQWKENPGSQAVHLVGELKNVGNQNLTGITLNLDLLDSGGNRVGFDSAASTVVVLPPGGFTPFEDVLPYPQPAGYDHFRVASVPSGPSISQPVRLPITLVASGCPRDNICGQVTNSYAATLDNPRAIFTYYDGSGKIVAQDASPIANSSSGAFVLAHNDMGTFTEDPTWFPPYVSYAIVIGLASSLDYPVDLNPASLSFAGQVVGTSSPADHVTLTNNGPRPLATNGGIATSGDFSQTNNCGSVASRSSCVIDVIFTPTATGTRIGSLSVSDDGAGSPQAIPLSGTGTMPVAHVSPTALAFGSMTVGSTSDPQTVTLSNTGDGAMTVTSITVDANFSQSNTCGSSLAIGASCSIAVRFTPGQVGDISGSLRINDNASGTPQAVQLSGTAVGAGVQLTPGSLDFGSQIVGSQSSAKTISLKNSGNAPLTISSIAAAGDFAQSNDCPFSLAAGNACTLTVTFTPSAVGARSGSVNLTDNAGSQSATLSGTGTGRPAAVITGTSNQQYTLAGNNGTDWQVMDGTNLVLSIPSSTAPGRALLSANGDLWTELRGVNQDIGIFVNDGTTETLAAWKESGGFAGTFSPNAAFVQTSIALLPGKSYSVTLKWKANHATAGKIHAGAGTTPNFSPTTLTAQVVAGGVISVASTRQYTLANNNGVAWQAIDAGALVLTIPASMAPGTAILSGNSDLWTQNAGVNQDIGLFVNDGTSEQLVAWKESGGFAGTFSPNAAFVQASLTLLAGKNYTVTLKWKTNHPTGGTIRAGAGLDPNFSPTTLTALVAGGVSSVTTNKQYTLAGSNGSSWQLVDGSNLLLTIPASDSPRTAILSGNADLWTENAGVNQDLGLMVNDGTANQVLVAWKESGGFAGTFSPNAAFVQATITLAPGKTYMVTPVWKANHTTAGKIHVGAGVDPDFSPITVTALIVPAS